MIFRQKKLKKKEKLIENFNAIFFLVDFVPQSQHPSHIIPNYMCHPERCASSYALVSKNASGSHHSSTKPLIPGFPIRSSSSSSFHSSCGGLLRRPSNRFHSTKSFTRVENTKKNCIKHQNRIKEFLPKTENQFSSCVLSQEEVDRAEDAALEVLSVA